MYCRKTRHFSPGLWLAEPAALALMDQSKAQMPSATRCLVFLHRKSCALGQIRNTCSLVQPEAPLDLRKSMTPQMLRRQGMRTPSRHPSLMEVMGVCLGASSPAGGTIVTSNTAAATLPTSRHLHALCPGCALHVMSGGTRPRYCSWAGAVTHWLNKSRCRHRTLTLCLVTRVWMYLYPCTKVTVFDMIMPVFLWIILRIGKC